jgi:hypothetical protein
MNRVMFAPRSPAHRAETRCHVAALMSALMRQDAFDLPLRGAGIRISDEVCMLGDGAAGRRLTCCDARTGYRRSEFRPGLFPVLERASASSRPPSATPEVPHRGSVSNHARGVCGLARVYTRAQLSPSGGGGSHWHRFNVSGNGSPTLSQTRPRAAT